MDKEKDTSGSGDASTSGEDANKGKPELEIIAKLKREKDNQKAAKEALEAELKALKDDKLKEKENYKALYETAVKDAETLKSELSARDTMINEGKINSSISAELLKAGVSPDKIDTAKRLIEKTTVMLDKETGVVVGAVEAVQAFVKAHADLGFFGKNGSANHNAGANESVGSASWQKAKSTDEMIKQFKQATGKK